MKISVITVCFNSAGTISDTLRSVAEQTHPDVEHIVIDGGSKDETLAIISANQGRVAHLVSEPDRGIYDAMNKGLDLATGEVIGFLNSDDIYSDRETLAEIAHTFADGSVDACYGDVLFVAARDTNRPVRYWKAGEYRPDRLLHGWMPPHPTFYVRRKVYAETGRFDLDYRLQADFEMAIRLVLVRGLSARYIPRTLVRMRMGGASNASIGNVVRGNLEAYRAVRKHRLPVGPLFVLVKICSRLPQFLARP